MWICYVSTTYELWIKYYVNARLYCVLPIFANPSRFPAPSTTPRPEHYFHYVAYSPTTIVFNHWQFVCLSVGNITEKCVNRFSWNFQDRSGIIQGTIWGMSCLNPWVLGFFCCGKSMSASNIMGKRMNGFAWNFQQGSDMRQGMTWNILGCCGWPLESRVDFFYLLNVCLLVMLWKTGERILMQFSWNVRHDTK